MTLIAYTSPYRPFAFMAGHNMEAISVWNGYRNRLFLKTIQELELDKPLRMLGVGGVMFFGYKSESIYTSIIANPTMETFSLKWPDFSENVLYTLGEIS